MQSQAICNKTDLDVFLGFVLWLWRVLQIKTHHYQMKIGNQTPHSFKSLNGWHLLRLKIIKSYFGIRWDKPNRCELKVVTATNV